MLKMFDSVMLLLSQIKRIRFGFSLLYQQYVSPLIPSGYGKMGKGSIIKSGSSLVKQNIYADDWVIIQNHINFISNNGRLFIGKYSVVSSGCIIIPGSHTLTVGVPFYLATTSHINDQESDVIIDEDCWIGANSILLPKVHIGRGAVVGAGSVVTKDIPPYAVVVGVPAKIIATKFTLDQILRHEAILYPPKNRLLRTELEELFRDKYQGLKAIGVDYLSDEDKGCLEFVKSKYGIVDYSGCQ